jgi:hypothetical protein
MPDKAIMTVHSEDGPPTIEQAARQLGVTAEAVDDIFGVVLIDPKQSLYGVQVDAERLPSETASETYRGPFSNPHIEPLGPPQSESDRHNKPR